MKRACRPTRNATGTADLSLAIPRPTEYIPSVIGSCRRIWSSRSRRSAPSRGPLRPGLLGSGRPCRVGGPGLLGQLSRHIGVLAFRGAQVLDGLPNPHDRAPWVCAAYCSALIRSLARMAGAASVAARAALARRSRNGRRPPRYRGLASPARPTPTPRGVVVALLSGALLCHHDDTPTTCLGLAQHKPQVDGIGSRFPEPPVLGFQNHPYYRQGEHSDGKRKVYSCSVAFCSKYDGVAITYRTLPQAASKQIAELSAAHPQSEYSSRPSPIRLMS